jgi:transcription antitermination factor NusG
VKKADKNTFIKPGNSPLSARSPGKAVSLWRAVYVNSRSEKKVMNALLDKNIEAYVPIVKTMRQWSDRKKMVEVALLNGYVFLHISEKEQEEVLLTPGVIRFVRSEGKIAFVRDIEIDRLKQLVVLGYHLEAAAIDQTFSKGDKVNISAGVLKGLEGVIISDHDQKHLLVLLESIGQCIKVSLPKEILTNAK